ncbi:Ribonuclease H domain - like 10 [Theobroma cacao]|nr:Ribonuclease H domain - like 10 [Theobroma cacao]
MMFQGKSWDGNQCLDLARTRVAWWAEAKWPEESGKFEDIVRKPNMVFLQKRHQKTTRTANWIAPRTGVLKFNVDGAARGSLCLAEIGGVLRDSDSAIKVMFSKAVGVTDANTAEVVVIKEALKIFVSSKWKDGHLLEIENDSSNTETWIKDPDKSLWRMRKIMLGIEGPKRQVGLWKVLKVPRAANDLADNLAKGGVERREEVMATSGERYIGGPFTT